MNTITIIISIFLLSFSSAFSQDWKLALIEERPWGQLYQDGSILYYYIPDHGFYVLWRSYDFGRTWQVLWMPREVGVDFHPRSMTVLNDTMLFAEHDLHIIQVFPPEHNRKGFRGISRYVANGGSGVREWV